MDLENPIMDPGIYEVRVVADGQSMACAFGVPPREPIPCSAPFYIYGTSSTGGPYADNLASIEVPGHFARIEIDITLEGTTILSESFTPRYDGVEINGPGCGECPLAVETVRVPAP